MDQKETTLKITEVFRNAGYEGSSMADLAKAAGLAKSSLYHHYKDGKKEMAELSLKEMRKVVNQHLDRIINSDNSIDQKLDEVLDTINMLYKGGKAVCLLRSLSIGQGLDLFQPLIQSTFEDLIKAFKALAFELDFDETTAQKLAEDIIIKIQGSLVLSRSMKNTDIFKRNLQEIKTMYLKG